MVYSGEDKNILQAWKSGVDIIIKKPNQAIRDVVQLPVKVAEKTGEVVSKGVSKPLTPILIVAGLGIVAYLATPYIMSKIRKGGKL